MEKLSYRDLSKAEKTFVDSKISNGCGGKDSIFKVPNYKFGASCGWHDFEYWRGGDKLARLSADHGFYIQMCDDADELYNLKRIGWWKWKWYRGAAWRYYKSVRIFGGGYFHHTDVPRGRVELRSLMVSFKY